jgi:hypothetical protein
MPVAFTDLFNEALDDLTATLTAVSGLQVVNDPRNLVPPCVFIDAPSFDAFNYNIVKLDVPSQNHYAWPSQPRRATVAIKHYVKSACRQHCRN